jgi:small GTP-binding protein
MNDEDRDVKTILVGMSGSGKTNIINALVGRKFDESKFCTTTSSFLEKIMTVKKKKYHLEIWDTAGQEQYRSLTKIFINDSKIVIFVYDITNRESFNEIDYWVNTVKEKLGNEPIFGLVGNKKDLFLEETVKEEEGEKKAKEIGAIFRLTSAKTGQALIIDYLQNLLEEYVKKIGDINEDKDNESNRFEKSNSFSINTVKEKKSKCC